MKNNQNFLRLAIQLAKVEEQLNLIATAFFSERRYSIFAESQKRNVMFAAGGAAAAFIILLIIKGTGLFGLLIGAAFIYALQTLYVAYGGMKFAGKYIEAEQKLQSGSDQKRNERSHLRDELIRMQQENPSLPQECWWNCDIDPEKYGALYHDFYSDYEYLIANELSVISKEGKLYLEDFTEVAVLYSDAQIREMIQSNSAGIFYEDKDLLSGSEYICFHLYRAKAEIIEEISGKTTIVLNDKDARMREFEDKLNRQERFFNYLDDRGSLTNFDLFATGKMTSEEYYSKSIMRDLEVFNKQSELNMEPDSYEETEYTKRFRGLYKASLITCAYIFCAADGENRGKVALILYPGRELPALDFICRSDSRDSLSGGYLTDYADQEGLKIIDKVTLIEFQDIADYLFSEEVKSFLGLKERNILLPKPENINDEEWSYLIWKDHPQNV